MIINIPEKILELKNLYTTYMPVITAMPISIAPAISEFSLNIASGQKNTNIK